MVKLRVACAGATCDGTVVLRRQGAVLGRASFRIADGRTATVKVKLANRRKLGRVTVALTVGAGAAPPPGRVLAKR